ncbi:hypothetical protein [Ensifer soli]|uniref:hypothetical protein n=1 Tax=Ciceribacter sp. sgz301302 TaxID=3342379 RepID=UPI0035B902A0
MDFVYGLGVAIVLVAVTVMFSKTLSTAVRQWLGFGPRPSPILPEPPAAPEPDVEPEPEPEPEPVIEIHPPDFGNIRPVRGEEKDPTSYGPDVHDFPEMGTPATCYEDFNRKLFIVFPASRKSGVWPNTTSDDFPTKIKDISLDALKEEIRLRLRPRYPVILDTYGHWSSASYQLEQNPDYTDEFVSSYLAIPEARRPVVVSVWPPEKDGSFTFIRYGFEDYTLTLASMRFHLRPCLVLLMRTMTGPRDQWLWLSVARMRQTVIRAFQADEARKRENQATSYLEQQTLRAKQEAEHRNRFIALWNNRVTENGKPAEGGALPAPETSRTNGAAQ